MTGKEKLRAALPALPDGWRWGAVEVYMGGDDRYLSRLLHRDVETDFQLVVDGGRLGYGVFWGSYYIATDKPVDGLPATVTQELEGTLFGFEVLLAVSPRELLDRACWSHKLLRYSFRRGSDRHVTLDCARGLGERALVVYYLDSGLVSLVKDGVTLAELSVADPSVSVKLRGLALPFLGPLTDLEGVARCSEATHRTERVRRG